MDLTKAVYYYTNAFYWRWYLLLNKIADSALYATIKFFVNTFQLRMMQAEVNVEEIVHDRSLKVISINLCCKLVLWLWLKFSIFDLNMT